MDKIKCVIAKNGTIIPIHDITSIKTIGCTAYVWTNNSDGYYELSNKQYNDLLNEINFI